MCSVTKVEASTQQPTSLALTVPILGMLVTLLLRALARRGLLADQELMEQAVGSGWLHEDNAQGKLEPQAFTGDLLLFSRHQF